VNSNSSRIQAQLISSKNFSKIPQSFSDYLSVAGPLLQQGKLRFRVISNSMAPALKAGDLVKLSPACPGKLSVGQMVVVSLTGQLICHRLIRSFSRDGQRWMVTKGDQVTGEDPPVSAEQIIGIVSSCTRPRIFHRLLWRLRGWGGRQLRRWRFLRKNFPGAGIDQKPAGSN